MIEIRKPYESYPDPGIDCGTEDMTKQQFKDECDINVILRRYQETGLVEHVRDQAPQYLDATEIDYQQAMFMVAQAKSVFAAMPAELRDRFENDPARLLAFVHDPKNLAESIELGFIHPEKLPQSLQAASITPAKGGGSGEPAAASPAPSGAAGAPAEPAPK